MRIEDWCKGEVRKIGLRCREKRKITYDHAVKPQLSNTIYSFICFCKDFVKSGWGEAGVMTGHTADSVLWKQNKTSDSEQCFKLLDWAKLHQQRQMFGMWLGNGITLLSYRHFHKHTIFQLYQSWKTMNPGQSNIIRQPKWDIFFFRHLGIFGL